MTLQSRAFPPRVLGAQKFPFKFTVSVFSVLLLFSHMIPKFYSLASQFYKDNIVAISKYHVK